MNFDKPPIEKSANEQLENSKEILSCNRMPITIEINGHLENVWAKYQLGREIIIGDCTKCGKESQELEIQKPENVEVETDSPEIEKMVYSKLFSKT